MTGGNSGEDSYLYKFKQLTSTANSHWQLGGLVELGGTTADTLNVAGDLTITGHIVQFGANGGTTIAESGVLTLGTNGVVDGDITDNGRLVFNSSEDVDYNNLVSGTGSLTQAGAGNLTLSTANTYTGATAVNAGTLTTGVAHALDASSNVDVSSNAMFNLNNFSQTLKGLTGSGNVNLGTAELEVENIGEDNFAGIISGTGSLTKSGAGNLTLSGASNYTGATSVKAGTLTTGAAHTLDSSSGVDVASNATLNLSDNAQILKGLTGAGNVILGSANLEVNNASTDTFDGVISGTGSLTKNNTGTLTLGGNSTFTGGTTVNSGALSLTNNNAAGSGQINIQSGTNLDLAFSDASFTNTLTGAGQVTVSGNNIALNEDATSLTGGWDITGSASATQQSQLGNSGVKLDGTQSKLTLNNLGNTFTNALTGNGTLAVNQNSKTDEFHISGSMGTDFTGTVQMQQGNLTLDDTAERALANATLSLTRTGIATMSDDRSIGGLVTGGGTLIVDNTRTDPDTLTTQTLDASAGGTIQANIPTDLTPPVISTNASWFDQDDTRDVQVVNTTGDVTGVGTHFTLLDQNGNSVSNAQQVDIVEGGNQLGTATYDTTAVATENGIWAGYDLVKLSANAGQTLALQNEPGQNNALGAQLTGEGNFDIQASGTVILNNSDNDYTGNTQISSGNVQMGSDNALGHTADVSLAANTGLDMNGKTQAITSLHGATDSNLNLNGGNLSIAQGGESHGTLSGGGQLNLNGGELTVHGANQNLSATTTIAAPATATLDNTQGLGNGAINLAGNLNLTGANGVMSNSLTGNGNLSLQNGSQVTLADTASTFAGNINVATDTQLTAQGSGTLGSANVTDNGRVVLDTASDWTLNNVISGTGSVDKNGVGNATLTHSNTYSGGTHINAGTLSLAKNDAAGSGVMDVSDTATLDLAFSDASFTNTLTGAGQVTVSGNHIALNEDATAFTGDWDITGSASATQQSQLGNAGVQLDGSQSKLTLNGFNDALTNALTGNGTLAVNQSNKTDEFHLADSVGTAFTGTVQMQQGNLILDDAAEKTLAGATLSLTQTGIATVSDDRSIGGLVTGGGTLIVDNTRTDPDTLTTKTLDASAGGTIQANISTTLTPPVVPTNASWFDQDDTRDVQVVNTTGDVTGVGTHFTLLDQNGNRVSNATQVNFTDGGEQIGTATYDTSAVATDDGIWAGYDLVKFSINDGQTLVLQNAPGQDNALSAQLTGAGNVNIQANGTVILNNSDNDYTGNTQISSGNVQMGSDNALGHTADISLAANTGLDMNGKTQAITTLHGVAGSGLNLNGGNLSIAQGGESLGTLSGGGQLNLNGGELTVHGANQNLSATTTIAAPATATLDNTQGLGNGAINLAGNLNLTGANGVMNNALTGNGNLSLQNGSQVTLANIASTFAGSIDVATGTQLTAQGSGTLGSARVTDNGHIVLDTATDWTLNNAISGTGGVDKNGVGTVTVGSAQTYAGDTHINQGALAVNGNFGSTGTVYVANAGTLKGNGSIAGSVDNSGVIDLTSDTVGNNLTIGGDYASHDGQLWVNSTLGGDNSAHDQLTVKGNTSGNTNVTVNNMHGLGAQTVNGIELVNVQGQSEGTFTLQGRAVAGAYDYSLGKGGDGNWYLQSASGPRPEAGAWLANQSMANSVFMNTLHDRSDENRQSGEDAPATWAHFDAGRTNSKAGNGALSMGSNSSVLRIGSDIYRHDFGNQRINAGVMTGYANVDTDSDAKHTSDRATGKLEGYNFGVYGTWYGGAADQKTGPYVDTWMQYGTFHNTVKGNDLADEKYHSHNWMASVEVGYDMPVAGLSAVYLQPQFQTLYTDYNQGNHTDSNGTRIQSQDSGGVTTRLGARLYGELGTETVTQPYVEVNWWHGGSDNSVKMDTDTVDQNIPVSRYEAKVGVQVKASKDWTLWINSGVEMGKDNYSSVQGQVGGKYSW
ncbi:autotransporter outer membrane beta-barrel domain-containing protein [Obesumbacterium proteus]|uniref:autotransporter outer membrane beta-barrel domain-containing protein n=1 Tax=Obesumbacterium proteus TaxID=82983 RepID=UPI001F3E3060|nr:autotransporter outer membrane beta-barrel domain-containing protein [Obesumbacterium proteus]MCE9886672.1 autotransporter outer membrane beta-barrel domain-containing protein [Obesumbacterium proteus]MCE9917972.1 autotransporter outer membrane beta-barrel domain-containing protein [Obesumbacterium proteus]MCE9929409.1 autotransporter outer membrane beta-barrel domain-containing protein [Obesumbacterium proteus]MCG2878804.1 autotransporter outer membrane beta-barrel domain-containing protein